MSKYYVNPKTGLVACEILKGSASQGVVEGEVRGIAPDLIDRLVARKAVRPLDEKEVKTLIAERNKRAIADREANPVDDGRPKTA